MSRLPVRWRLTAAFALVMAAVLLATGAFVRLRLSADLNHAIDRGLRARLADVAALVQQSDTGLREAGAGDAAQILDARGRVFDATPGFLHRPLLAGATLTRARRGPLTLARPGQRLATMPVSAQGQRLVIVAAAPLRDRQQALASLARVLWIGGAAALLLASAAGFGLAGAALRPVNSLLARLSAALARERRFVADASHELRTPLAMLRTELDLMADERPTGHELDSAVDSLRDEVRRLGRLAEDLLVLARAEDGKLPVRPEPLRAGELLTRVADRYARTTPRTVVAEDTDAWIGGDPLRLEQALGNLVDNALGHGGGEVRLRAVAAGSFVELHVSDEGPGFSAEAFEPFVREDPAREGERVGLGLAIVRAVARGHGGDVGVTGADVWLTVPAHAPSRTGELLVIDR